ncbi:hypothetical protein CONPUDRAFT_70040 [Coniophora puteana RWD-64-598 SS2]|uniref:Nucleoporin n=1 Tax=Coniophora puteana (strain RWD-64-598) TaxID=741705 RepID=A0A5M3N1K7_CONPW|nr:uncharacterized protein CONPUDRAFT_70040 [Coniophora puteana RWD-64-598 SS2]EIW85147.1 hypothetical protein CONPUDRAFT_70040 [Coniophora puteana RWD-64-598 SS2]
MAEEASMASITSSMDIDEAQHVSAQKTVPETIFAKSEELSVSFYANLPTEVKQILKGADFYGESYSGGIDTETGYALVASQRACFVWQYAQSPKGSPTCYIFSSPGEGSNSCPFHALVPFGATREPGLVLLAPHGELRFWESISNGLAGGDHFSTSQLSLEVDEYITNLTRVDPQTYVASTSIGHLFRFTLSSTGGKYHLAARAFSQPSSSSLSLTRLLPSRWTLASAGLQPKAGNISSIAIEPVDTVGIAVDSRQLWALVDSRLQKWNIHIAEGWEEPTLDEDLLPSLHKALREQLGAWTTDDERLDLELVDLQVKSARNLLLLISFSAVEDENSMMADHGPFGAQGPRRRYALVHMSQPNTTDTIKVEGVRRVPYQSTTSSGAPIHPRIHLLSGAELIAVHFGDVVALCSRYSVWEDRLTLKYPYKDQMLGLGVMEFTDSDQSSLLVLSAGTIMKASLSLSQIADFDPESGRAHLIKSILTQAILYGSIPENPLHFSFPPDVDEDGLMNGAEQLSKAVIESDPEIIRPDHDLTSQLTSRKERLSWLIHFINDNGVLTKLSQSSRQRLATDAEKLYACHQLWTALNDHLDHGATHSILTEAVYDYMHSVGNTAHEDVVRAFFKYRVGDVGKLFPFVMESVNRLSKDVGRSLAASLPESISCILTILSSALDYRAYNLGVYGVTLPMIKPWTSRPGIIDTVLGMFDVATKFLDGPSDAENSGAKTEPRKQLPALASVLFTCINERLEWLRSIVAAGEAGTEVDRKELSDRFAQLRPEIFETLRIHGHLEHAFSLAEACKDFRSLASLCHKDKVWPPQENPHMSRIENYIQKFRDEFTAELYQWYIEHGELRGLFTLEDSQKSYMDVFFAAQARSSISWIYDLGQERYGAASAALVAESKTTDSLAVKHFALSVGKLAHLAQIQDGVALDETSFDAFHDGLDFVSVQQNLLEEMRTVLSTLRGKQSIENQVDAIVKAKASTIRDRRALLGVFKALIRLMLQNHALSVEDAVDVLTLKDNSETIEDYATALQLLSRVQDLPDARKASSFRRVWCRIYSHDNWDQIRQTANVTDSQLMMRLRGTALYNTLSIILRAPHHSPGYDLDPSEALVTPDVAELASRWPGMPQEQVEALERDYRAESNLVASMKLEDVYHRVRELAKQDLSDGQEVHTP